MTQKPSVQAPSIRGGHPFPWPSASHRAPHSPQGCQPNISLPAIRKASFHFMLSSWLPVKREKIILFSLRSPTRKKLSEATDITYLFN